jgi:hypothetical protein
LDVLRTQASEMLSQFFQFSRGQRIAFSAFRTPSHSGRFWHLLLLFVTGEL